jgi:phosphate transport system substrate-binding protein
MFKRFAKTAAAAVISFGLMGVASAEVKQINGAGATFPYPVYSKWAEAYHKETGVKFNYQAIGSGGGIKQIKAKTVDFGASDAPLKAKDLDAAGLMQFPMIMGGVVPVVNVPGIKAGQLHLDSEVLADIFLGEIKKWNDSRIASINKGLKLPDQDITVVHRSDGSGTTFIYTNYLTKISKKWADKVGNNKAVDWPAGVGGKGNQGVAAYVNRIKGSIGYVEYAYALQNKMAYTLLKNHDG